MKKIEIITGGQKAQAVLFDDKVPKICETLWKSLPIKGELHYAKIAGKEVFFITTILLSPPFDQEVSVTKVEPGTLVFFPNRQFLCIFYGHTQEKLEVLIVGKILNNLEKLEDVFEKVKIKQGEEITIRRA